MWSIAFKQVRANLARFIATLIAIAVGVSFLTAGSMLTTSIERSLGGEVDEQYADVSAAITSKVVEDDAGFSRSELPSGIAEDIADVDGVRAVAGEAMGITRFTDDTTATTGDSPFDIGPIVRNWIADEALNPLTIVRGRAPKAEREIAIDAKTADEEGLDVGSSVGIATAAGGAKVKVVGITRFGSSDSADQSGTITAAEPWVFSVIGDGEPAYSTILVAATTGTTERALVDSLKRVAPDTVRVQTGSAFRDTQKEAFSTFLDVLRPVLQGFSGLAIFVCAFVIYNTFAVVVTQRIREVALMRAIAATPRQIRRSLQAEGLVIGLIGSLAGLAAGAGLTVLLSWILKRLDLGLPPSRPVFTTSILLQGLIVGVGVTFIAVLIPSFRAGRTAPVAAMREAAVESAKAPKVRTIVAAVLVVLGVAGMATTNGVLLAVGAAFALIGTFMAGPALAVVFSKATGALARALGIAGRLGSQNLARQPKRTSNTVNALVIGVFLVTLVTISGNSLKRWSVDSLNDLSTADFVLGTPTGALPEPVLTGAAKLDGVTAFVPMRSFATRRDGHPDAITSADPAQLAAIGFKTSAGSLDDLGDGAAVSSFSRTPVKLGDTIAMTALDGRTIELSVRAILEPSLDTFQAGVIVAPSTLDAIDPGAPVQAAMIAVSPSKVDDVDKAIAKLTRDYANVFVQKGNFVGQIIGTVFDFMINAVNGLLGMSVVIALIGIVNTLSLSTFERRRELGLLRAVGMSAREVRRMVRIEAVLIALLGTTTGIAIGSLLAWLLLRSTDLGAVSFAPSKLAWVFAAGVLVGLVASIPATRRVTKFNVLDALAVD